MIDNEVRHLAAQMARRLAQRSLNGEQIDLRAEKARMLELEAASKGLGRKPFETNLGKKGWHKLHQPSAGRRSGHRGDTEPNLKGFREDLRKLK
jgi:hypothetical protein